MNKSLTGCSVLHIQWNLYVYAMLGKGLVSCKPCAWLDESGWFTCIHTRMALSTWGVPGGHSGSTFWRLAWNFAWNCLWEFLEIWRLQLTTTPNLPLKSISWHVSQRNTHVSNHSTLKCDLMWLDASNVSLVKYGLALLLKQVRCSATLQMFH